MKSGNSPKKWECSVSSGNSPNPHACAVGMTTHRQETTNTSSTAEGTTYIHHTKKSENTECERERARGAPSHSPSGLKDPRQRPHGPMQGHAAQRADDQSTLHTTSIPSPFFFASFKKNMVQGKVGNQKGFPRRRANGGSSCLLILFIKNRKGQPEWGEPIGLSPWRASAN